VPFGETYDFRYAPTLQRASESSAGVRIVQGPVESGKTVWLCMEIMFGHNGVCTIPRCKDGIRRSRHLVFRSTESELQRGIMRTWRDLFPEEVYGPIVGSMPAIQKLRFLDVEAEVEFFAFEDDREAVLKKLRSTEYTTTSGNEGQFCPFKLALAVRQRGGRYPKRIDCPDYDRQKKFNMDMNAPRVYDHWVPLMRQFEGDAKLPRDASPEERRKYQKPDDWEFFVQPPIVLPIYDVGGSIIDFKINPDGENLPYQKESEILAMCATGDIDDVKRDYMNELVVVKSGEPRYPDFKRSFHVASSQLEPVENVPPIIGYDPGLTGGATFWQKINEQWRGYFEMNAHSDLRYRGVKAQGDRMLEILSLHFPWYIETGVILWGDPYGNFSGKEENDTYYETLNDMGLVFQTPFKKDNPTLRHATGKSLVKRGIVDQPALLLCPVGLPTFTAAIEGGAVMKTVKRDGDLVVQSELLKNKHSHIIESAEYAWVGGGENYKIIEKPNDATAPIKMNARSSRSPFSRKRSSSLRSRKFGR